MNTCERCTHNDEHGWGGLFDGKSGVSHCHGCHRNWASKREAHCTVCHRHFSTDENAERHVASGKGYACLSDSSMRRKGLHRGTSRFGYIWRKAPRDVVGGNPTTP